MAALDQASRNHAACASRAVAAEPLAEGAIGRALDPDVQPGESENEQAKELGVVDRCLAKPLVQRIGAKVADLFDALLADLRPCCLRLVHPVIARGATRARRALDQAERHLADLAGALIDVEANLVALARLAVGALRARR